MLARIYSPAKTAMQSGKANLGVWILQYEPEQAKMIEPLMGYTSSSDSHSQISLKFKTKDEAVAFAVKNGILFRIEAPHKRRPFKNSYADNFRSDRQLPWTH